MRYPRRAIRSRPREATLPISIRHFRQLPPERSPDPRSAFELNVAMSRAGERQGFAPCMYVAASQLLTFILAPISAFSLALRYLLRIITFQGDDIPSSASTYSATFACGFPPTVMIALDIAELPIRTAYPHPQARGLLAFQYANYHHMWRGLRKP